jgi:hypothetical protein
VFASLTVVLALLAGVLTLFVVVFASLTVVLALLAGKKQLCGAVWLSGKIFVV